MHPGTRTQSSCGGSTPRYLPSRKRDRSVTFSLRRGASSATMGGVTGPLPSASARGKALRREIAALGVAASCDAPDLWAASRDCSAGALLLTQARVVPHPPDVVALRADVDQVAALLRLAAQREVPVVA